MTVPVLGAVALDAVGKEMIQRQALAAPVLVRYRTALLRVSRLGHGSSRRIDLVEQSA